MWNQWSYARAVAFDVVFALSIVVLYVDKVGTSPLDKLYQSNWEVKVFAPNSPLSMGLPEKFKPTSENARVLGVKGYPFSTSNGEVKDQNKELAEFNANIFFWLKFAEWLNRVEESLNCPPAEADTEKCPVYADSAKKIGADLFAAGNAIDESVKAFVETIAGIAHHEFRLITNKALSEEQFKLFGAEIKVNVSVPTTTSAASPNIASLLRQRKFVVGNSPTNNQQPLAEANDAHSHTLPPFFASILSTSQIHTETLPMLAKEAMTYMVIYTAQVLLKDMVYGSWTNLLKAETEERLRKANAKSAAAGIAEEESAKKMREAWQVVSSRLFTGYLVLTSNVEHKLGLISYRARLKEAHLYRYAVVGCAGTGSSHICHHKHTIAGRLLDMLHIPNHQEKHLLEEYLVNAIEKQPTLLHVPPFTLHLDPSLPPNHQDMERMLELHMQATNADGDAVLGDDLAEVDYLMTEVGTLKGLPDEYTSILTQLSIFLTEGKDWTVGKLAGLIVRMINSRALSRFRPRGGEANEFTLRLPKHWVWAQVMGMVMGLRAKKSGLEAASLYHNLVNSTKLGWSTEEVMEKLADDPKVRYWVFSLAHFYGLLHKMDAGHEEKKKETILVGEGGKADGGGGGGGEKAGGGGGGGGKWTRGTIKTIYEELLRQDHSHLKELLPGGSDGRKKQERKRRRRRRKKRVVGTSSIVALTIIGIIVVAATFLAVIGARSGSSCTSSSNSNSLLE